VDSRRWWLLAAAVPVALGCALATAQPALTLAGQLAIIGAGLLAAAVLWRSAARTTRPRAWRMLAVAPLLPVSGTLLTLANGDLDPVTVAVLRWAPTVPGYVVSIIAVMALVDRRSRRYGLRIAVEVALFLAACLVVVSMLVVGPAGAWSTFDMTERLVLGSAVLATSATMAAALTLLAVIEAGRRPMAVVLLAGTVFLTLGRGLATSALLSGTPPVPAGVARGIIAAGLLLLALAALIDSGRAPTAGADPDPATTGHQARLGVVVGALLPHLALLIAVATVGTAALTGAQPGSDTIAGLVLCVLLAAVHRGLSAREEQRLGARLRRSEAYFRSVVQSAGDAVVILDDDLHIRWASPALDRALREAASALVGRSILDSVHPDDVPALAAVLPVTGSTPEVDPAGSGLLTLRLRDAAGQWRYLEAGVSDLRHVPDVGAVVLHCRDMTERYAREQALQSIAYTDPMTGLPNRAGLLQALETAVTDPGDAPATLLMIQLVGLATARENTGREAVTAAVAEVGRRLRATVRGEDTVARMGGGAFAVLAHGDDADSDRLADRCLSVVEQPIRTAAGLIELSAGVGVVAIEAGLDVDGVLGRADLAVRAAHEAGAGSAYRYDDALGDAAARRDLLRRDLQAARAKDELSLLFQPIVSLEQQRITGVEAELRWRHGTLGDIPPAEFLPLAERAGLIGELVRWTLEAATTAAHGLPAAGAPLRLGIKVPFGYLAGGTIVADVESALRCSGLAPERLVLEISAPAVMSGDERFGLDVSSLRLMGVHVALHGFGSGSSALAHLTRLPIDIVKLDRSLISRIDRDPQSRALCESVIGIGRALGLDVVAEGVETTAQLATLTGFGCGFARGFLIGRPMRLPGFTAQLAGGGGVLLPGLVGSR
jgi:diguanylate cyclase (GGDEF)-like protein/PAS domain S-box-containing protein